MYETIIAETWLKAVLAENAELNAAVGGRIFAYLAPNDAPYPFVLFALDPGPTTADTLAIGGNRIKSNLGYVVKVVGKTNNFQSLGPIAEAIDQALHKKYGTVPDGGSVISCIRTAPVADVEMDELTAEVYRHLGGLYALQVQKS
jgi:hypothetical protein